MFTVIYTKESYNFWKSGMLLDFFFKKFISNIVFFLFFTFNINFTEKYLIEQNFLKLSLYLNYLKSFFNITSKNIVYYGVGFIWIFNIIILIIILSD